MIRGISFLSAFLMCLLMLGHLEGASAANAAAVGTSLLTSRTADQSTNAGFVQAVRYRHGGHHGYYRHRGGYGWRHHGYRHHRYYGYYGYYPFYFGSYYYQPYYSYPYYGYRRYAGRCSYWRRRCARNWGYGNSNYYGCLRYYGCR